LAADKYKVITEKFEGPLDLLLHLINKEEIDVYDIPIASVTEQYLAYILSRREFDIELASEFLLMAATLLQIKSRMLLPPQPAAEEAPEDAPDDPRRELAERLVDYRQFKFMGEQFARLWDDNARFFTRASLFTGAAPVLAGPLAVERLLAALASVLEARGIAAAAYDIYSDEFNVQDKINDILRLLQNQSGRLTLRDTLTRAGSAGELIAAFLALLELLRIGRVGILQPEKFGDIYLYAKDA
jgi:segregation and condensation protein A